jgi:uncharacterized protein (TIGR02996 family)
MSDDAAFLRAIASDPADDTARLAYADFLEETGDEVHAARADFIRAQVEAHTRHPNDPRRAELETRAAVLFGGHWIQWWEPLCAILGLPPPHVSTDGLRSRLGQFLLGRTEPHRGHPYSVQGGTTLGWVRPLPSAQTGTFVSVAFERGFSQRLDLTGELTESANVVRRWTRATPLTALHLSGIVALDWKMIDGEHLHGVRELSLLGTNTAAVRAVAASPHLPRLEELSLRPDRSNAAWAVELYRTYAASPLAGRVKQLQVVIRSTEEVEALHGPHLANLARLHIIGPPTVVDPWPATGAALARSKVLSGLRELSLSGSASAMADGGLPDWLTGQLRQLTVEAVPDTLAAIGNLVRRDPLPALTDLSLRSTVQLEHLYSALAASPLAGRLCHLRLTGGWGSESDARRELLRLADVLASGPLETLALGRQVRYWPEVWDELQERFTGRVSVV